MEVPNVYVHAFAGGGLSYLSSSDIKDVVSDDFGIGLGLPTWSYGLRGGFRTIAQVSLNIGRANHNFNNNSIIPDIPSEVIEMDYETTDVQFKVNPFFWRTSRTASGQGKAWFLVWGFTEVDWKDEVGDGFSGKGNIIGIEYALVSTYLSGNFSFKRYAIDFDQTILFGLPFTTETSASDWIFEIKIGFGLGI